MATIYPLNYTLVLDEATKLLMLIHWDGPRSPTVIPNVVIEGVSEFSTVTCLDDSILCFASGENNDLLRFDIRTIENPSIAPNFNMKNNYGKKYSKLMITDSNLKYLFGAVGHYLHLINPMNLTNIYEKKLGGGNIPPKSILSIMSSPIFVSVYNSGLIAKFKISSSDSFGDDKFMVNSGVNYK